MGYQMGWVLSNWVRVVSMRNGGFARNGNIVREVQIECPKLCPWPPTWFPSGQEILNFWHSLAG
eukprot:scaffold18203_cov33-Tisochrysis_lutea.AAC.2